jgi:erythromycin esterase-like protein
MATRTEDIAGRLRHARTQTADGLAATLRRYSEPLPDLTALNDFGARFDRFGSANVVLLGEATHGTSEFYRARAAITRRLIEQHGFSIVAVEADWPDAASIDAYVRHFAPRPNREQAFARFPQWMSIAAVLDFLETRDPAQAKQARERYSCLTPWQREPAEYGHNVLFGGDTCEEEAVAQLEELLARRLAYLKEDGEAFFDATQNARVVRSAEQYYRMMYRSSAESWNLRDRHMFDTLQALLAEARRVLKNSGRQAKAVVWAHNSHIGNAAATAMGWQGEFNIGELCRKAYGDAAVLIGFGTDRGTVAAADDWGGPMQIKSVRPARSDSYEHAFREAGCPISLTEWRSTEKGMLAEQLSESLLERAIGVIYRPETELQSHYFESVLADQFDAWVWFEETQAVTPLAPGSATGMPETYPFGV